MKYRGNTVLVMAAGLLVQSTALPDDAHIPAPNSKSITIKTNRDWARLRASASTAEEFRALAKWSELQAVSFHRKQADSAEQLRRGYQLNPARTQIMTNSLAHDKAEAQKWSQIAALYSAKAASTAVAAGSK